MDAEQRNKWVAALDALQTAAALPDLSDNQLRDWAIETLARAASPALHVSDIDEISGAFIENSREANLSGMPLPLQLRYKTEWSAVPLGRAIEPSGVLAQLGQTASPYSSIGPPALSVASYPSNPFSSPAIYLAHPGIDVLDQETITKIASRDTGA